jgi:fucose permease
MGYAIGAGHGWRTGYGIVSVIQLILTAFLFISLPLWKKRTAVDPTDENYEAPLTLRQAVGIKGVKSILFAFFAYCAFESTAGLWASTYLVEFKGVDAKTAATFASLFYIGITLGRFLSGFIADSFGDKSLIRIGLGIMAVGVALIILPISAPSLALAGLIIAGFGCAPIYPSVIHSTPSHFGKQNSHAIVGIQMASAYTGTTLMPPLFGIIAEHISIALYPVYLAVFIAVVLIMTERVNRVCK